MPEFWQTPFGQGLGALAGLAVGLLPGLLLYWWLMRRDRRRWQQEDAERQRQWALQQQLRDVEQQVWRESLPDWQREAIEEADRKRVEIRRDARRRLDLPEEDPSSC